MRQIESRALHSLCWSAATACACSLGPFSIWGRPNAAADIAAAVGYSAATDAAARYQGTSSLMIATTACSAGATETAVVAATAALR